MIDIKEGIIICNSNIKRNILKNIADFKDYTFMSLNSVVEGLTFSYSKKAILLLVEKYNIKPEVAKNYIENMRYINNDFGYLKLIELLKMKNYLIINNALQEQHLFLNKIHNKNITFIGYPTSKKINRIIDILKEKCNNIDFIQIDDTVSKECEIFEFDTLDNELRFIFLEISKLLDKGIEYKNIKIANFSNEYEFSFKRLASLCNIPISIDARRNILSTKIVKRLFELINEYSKVNAVISELRKEFRQNPFIKDIIDIFNDYEINDIIPNKMIEILKMELKNIPYEETIYDTSIEFIELENYESNDNDYVFLIGFNQNKVVKIKTDIDYINDEIKQKIGLDTSIEENILRKNTIIRKIYQIKNLVITYKLQSSFDTYLPSGLIKELDMKVIKKNDIIGVSEIEDRLIISEKYDDVVKYNIKSEIVNNYYYKNIRYNKYDNSYKKIDENIYTELKKNELKLSYSSLKDYYSCQFSFYLKHILRIGTYEQSLAAKIGTYAHNILQDSYKEGFNFLESSTKHLEICQDNKEKFFCKLSLNVLENLVEYNHEKEGKSELNGVLCEQNINISYFDNKLFFTGFVDKILYKVEEDYTYIAIIDYKTGRDEASTNNISDGFNLQLPIYLYMIKKSELFKNPNFIGFYLQKIAIDVLEEDMAESFKLVGFSTNEMSLLNKLDKEFHDSEYIAKMKVIKSGNFASYAKVITKDQENELYMLVEKLIVDAFNQIEEAQFNINPKKINGYDKSCTFCEFNDVCFKKYTDYVDLESNNFLAGGEEDVD